MANVDLLKWNHLTVHGRRHRGDWGDGPPKFEVGDGPCIRPPNILRSSVCRMRAKNTNRVKNGLIKELFSEIGVFLVKKESYMTLDTVKIWKIGKEIGKIWKNMVDD